MSERVSKQVRTYPGTGTHLTLSLCLSVCGSIFLSLSFSLCASVLSAPRRLCAPAAFDAHRAAFNHTAGWAWKVAGENRPTWHSHTHVCIRALCVDELEHAGYNTAATDLSVGIVERYAFPVCVCVCLSVCVRRHPPTVQDDNNHRRPLSADPRLRAHEEDASPHTHVARQAAPPAHHNQGLYSTIT